MKYLAALLFLIIPFTGNEPDVFVMVEVPDVVMNDVDVGMGYSGADWKL